MFEAFRSAAVTGFHDACLLLPSWPRDESGARELVPGVARSGFARSGDAPADDAPAGDAWAWVLTNHRFNCSLWDEEDLARRTQAADAEIALNKRHIDRFNQQRNDAMERIDDALLKLSAGIARRPSARLSSETAGAMIDRLSILSLKLHHMGLQTARTDVDEAHRHAARAKREQLALQRSDLAACYDRLLDEVAAGTGYFKIYRQFKMYNDPSMNPVLVAERQRARGA